MPKNMISIQFIKMIFFEIIKSDMTNYLHAFLKGNFTIIEKAKEMVYE